MSLRGRSEDISTLLYLVPFGASIVYALVLWVQTGLSATLPSSVYLTVTRDPILFVVASLAVMLGVMLEVNEADASARSSKLSSLGNTLQAIAIAALVLAIVSALYANGFTDLAGTADDFIVGRYGLVFPAILILLSYFLTAQFRLAAFGNFRTALAIAVLLLVPASLYEVGKRQTGLGLLLAFGLLLVGMGLYLLPPKKDQPAKQE